MLEREFEILLTSYKNEFFPNDWKLVAQQLGLPGGRLDLLYKDGNKVLQLVEIKKGRAPKKTIEQVLGYLKDLAAENPTKKVMAWVVAHSIGNEVKAYALEHGVNTLEIPESKCYQVMEKCGVSENDLLGVRLRQGVLNGGNGGIRAGNTDNNQAFSEMPQNIETFFRELIREPGLKVHSGNMQSTIAYQGLKLGGYNRKHRKGHWYISSGIVISPDFEQLLDSLSFERMTKIQKGSLHEHIWWELRKEKVPNFQKVMKYAKNLIDKSLG